MKKKRQKKENVIARTFAFYAYLINERVFFSYLFNNIRSKIRASHLLLNWNIIVIAFLIFILNILYFLPQPKVHLPSLTTMIFVIDTILKTSTIFFGLLVTFTTLSFSIFNKYYGRSAFYQFFKNKYARRLFTLFIINVVFNSYALSYLKESISLDNYGTSLFFLSIAYSILVTFMFFPTSISMLNQSQSLDNIKKIITEINEEDWLPYYVINNPFNTDRDQIDLKKEQEDPVKRIIEIGISAIKEFDYTTLELILSTSQKHFFTLIKKRKSSATLYGKFTDICDALFHVASSTRNDEAMKIVLREQFNFQLFLLDNKETIDADKEFELDWYSFSLERYFNKASRFNEVEVIESIIYWHKQYIKKVIKNIFPSILKINTDEIFQLTKPATAFLFSYRLIDTIIKANIEVNNATLWDHIFTFYSDLDYAILESNNEPSSQGYLLNVNGNNKLKAFEKYISTNPNSKSLLTPFTTMGIQIEIEKNETRTILNGFYNSLDILYAEERLNRKILNDLKATGLLFLNYMDKKPFYKKLLIELIEKFDHFRILTENGINEYQKDLYLKQWHFFTIVESTFLEYKNSDVELTEAFTRIKGNFNLIDKYTDELSRKGFLSNDRIIS